jgi:hypothetical protein
MASDTGTLVGTFTDAGGDVFRVVAHGAGIVEIEADSRDAVLPIVMNRGVADKLRELLDRAAMPGQNDGGAR